MVSPLISTQLSRESRLAVDNRIVFSESELRRILTAVKNRIHVEGKNALDEQMRPAQSYNSPRGLYRYLTGDLFNSTFIRQDSGFLVLSWIYESVILNSLEEMYGVIFAWSDADIREVRELERDKLREIDVPFDESYLNRIQRVQRARELEEIAREKEAAKSASELAPEGRGPTDEEIARELDDTPFNVPGAIAVESNQLRYDPDAKLSSEDIAAIRREVRRRIIVFELDANGNPIPEQVVSELNNATLQTIKVVKTRAGLLTLRVRHRNPALVAAMHEYNAPVFDWSPSDIVFVDAIVREKLDGPPGQETRRE